LAIAAAGDLYRAILDDIETHGFDALAAAPYSAWRKLSTPGIWWHNR
jgi:hypothetical protein